MHAKLLHSCQTLCDPRTIAHQAPLSLGFSGQDYWSEFSCLPPGDFPDPGIETTSLKSLLHWQASSLLLALSEKPLLKIRWHVLFPWIERIIPVLFGISNSDCYFPYPSCKDFIWQLYQIVWFDPITMFYRIVLLIWVFAFVPLLGKSS